MPTPSTQRPASDAARWISARARNALRRPTPILALGSVVFTAAIVAFIVVPYQMHRVARSLAPRPEERPDTAAILTALAHGRTALAEVNTTLARLREAALRRDPPPVVDTFPPALVARRDSLGASIATLDRQIERVETAPLAATFRTLAELPVVAADPRVGPLLDSLTNVEREREVFGAAGGVDPIYVVLTSRATALGRTIRAIADERLMALRQELAALQPPPAPAPVPRVSVDTMPLLQRRDHASAVVDSATMALARARAMNRELDERAEQARRLASVGTPTIAVLVAAVVLGLVSGYALALLLEFRRPRVADAREVERLTGVRVLGVIRPHEAPAERSRRRADHLAPPLLVPTDETYRRLYLHLVASDVPTPAVTFTGQDPAITGVVGANVAGMAALDARTTLLVDADLDRCTLAGVLRTPVEPGLSDILGGRAGWAESAAGVTVGRDRAIFVVPSGSGDAPPLTDDLRRALRDDLDRMARRYDLVFVVTSHPPRAHIGIELLPVPDVVYCAEVGRTSLSDLMRAVRELVESGARVRGIVLWDLDVPELPSREELTWVGKAPGRARPAAEAVQGQS